MLKQDNSKSASTSSNNTKQDDEKVLGLLDEKLKNGNNRKLSEDHSINSNESLLLLNDDCLLHMFTFFNIFELMDLETVCPRFADLINNIYSRRYQFVNLNRMASKKHNTFNEKHLILMRIGKYIKELKIAGQLMCDKENLIELIPDYCNNLEALRLARICNLNTDMLQKFLPIFKNLKILCIRQCVVSEEIDKCLQVANSLTELEYTFNYDVNGICLRELKNLKHLNISEYKKVTPDDFTEICKNNKTLIYLDISHCDTLNGRNFNDMVENLIHLEHLSMTTNYPLCSKIDFIKLANLKSLIKFQIKLSFDNRQTNFDDFVTALVNKDQLESFNTDCVTSPNLIKSLAKFSKLTELIMNYLYLTDNDLCKIGKRSKLKSLHLNYCSKITIPGILKCIELCPDFEFLNLNEYSTEQSEKCIFSIPPILKARSRGSFKKIKIYFPQNTFNYISSRHEELLLKNKDFVKILNYDCCETRWEF